MVDHWLWFFLTPLSSERIEKYKSQTDGNRKLVVIQPNVRTQLLCGRVNSV